MADGYVAVPTDGSGKKIDTTEFTRPDGSTVQRERMDVPNPVWIDGDVARLMLLEMRVQSWLLSNIFSVESPGAVVDLDQLRHELSAL